MRANRTKARIAWPALLALAGWVSPLGAQEDAAPGAEQAQAEEEVRSDQAAAAEADTASQFEATLLRTWATDDLTMVDGLAQVPLGMLAGGTTGAYRFELTVFDSDDTQLYRDTWERSLSGRAAAYTGAASSTMLEPFRFGVRSGDYRIEMRAYPTDAPDLGAGTTLTLQAYEERPVASDLFLADRVEPLEDQGGGSWSITHGGFGISAVARTTVMPQEPRLYYYIELYGDDEAEAEVELTASVVDESGRSLYSTPETTELVPVGGLPFAGSLSLRGLPPGEYDLRLEVDGAEAVSREAPFRMLDPAAAQPTLAASYETEYFQSLSEAELEETFGGVGYLVSESERQAYNSLPPDAKRRYLAEFFASRDAVTGGMGNSFLEEYLDRVGTVRMKYGELVGTGERAPWTTDAGRIYLRFGEPDERVVNHFPSGGETGGGGGPGVGSARDIPPYEIWAYHSTGYVYLFVQESRFNVWRMIYTSDPNMRSLADWQERVGREALRDMQTQFGIQPRF